MRYLSFVILAVLPILFMSFSKGQNDGSQACTKEYNPVCAQVQIECFTTPCDPIQETFGNRCEMEANQQATFLHEGECTDASNPTMCTMEYAPVCGVDGVTYSNDCMAQGTEIKYQGECALPELAYCTSYFDGCNNCSIEEGQVAACTQMYCETPTAPRCTAFADNVIINELVILDAAKKQQVKDIFTRVTAQWDVLDTLGQAKYYKALASALDTKVREWKNFAMVANFTKEGYALFQRKIVLFSYLHFLTQEKLQMLK